jgi:hypothetical protein
MPALALCVRIPLAVELNRVPTKHSSQAGEAILSGCEDVLKRRPAIKDLGQTMRFGHVGIHHQLVLPPVLQKLFDRHAVERPDQGPVMCGTKARAPCLGVSRTRKGGSR